MQQTSNSNKSKKPQGFFDLLELAIEGEGIIVVAMGPFMFPMVNPVITKKTGEYRTEESCLSLSGVRPCTHYKEIEVDYLDRDFKPQHGKYSDIYG